MVEKISGLLKRELEHRQKANPRYSQRAFARYLRIDDSFLTKIITGKRFPSLKLISEISKRLNWSDPFLRRTRQWLMIEKAKRRKRNLKNS